MLFPSPVGSYHCLVYPVLYMVNKTIPRNLIILKIVILRSTMIRTALTIATIWTAFAKTYQLIDKYVLL